MKNPGAIKAGSEDHEAWIAYTKALARRFDMAEAAIGGQILKFDEALQEICDHPDGMAALIIEVDDCDPTPWCAQCGAKIPSKCHCGTRADND